MLLRKHGVSPDDFAQGKPRSNSIDRDVVVAHLPCQSPGKPNDPSLRSDVVEKIGYPLEEGAGGDIDDLPLALLFHLRINGLGAKEDALEIDPQHLIPL